MTKFKDMINDTYYGYERLLHTIYDHANHVYFTALVQDNGNNDIYQVLTDYNSSKLKSLCESDWYVIGIGDTILESLDDYSTKVCNNLKRLGILNDSRCIDNYMRFIFNVLQYDRKETILVNSLLDLGKYTKYRVDDEDFNWKLIEAVRIDYNKANYPSTEVESQYDKIITINPTLTILDLLLRNSNFVLVYAEHPLYCDNIIYITPIAELSMYDRIDNNCNLCIDGYNDKLFFIVNRCEHDTYISMYDKLNNIIQTYLTSTYGVVDANSLNSYMEMLKNYKTTIMIDGK